MVSGFWSMATEKISSTTTRRANIYLYKNLIHIFHHIFEAQFGTETSLENSCFSSFSCSMHIQTLNLFFLFCYKMWCKFNFRFMSFKNLSKQWLLLSDVDQRQSIRIIEKKIIVFWFFLFHCRRMFCLICRFRASTVSIGNQ